jgi:hypothetical protein
VREEEVSDMDVTGNCEAGDGLLVGQKIFSNGIIDCIPQEIGHLGPSINDE